METLTYILSGTLIAATPLLIGALGELVAEKSGVLNLSVEGMMALGAVFGFITVVETGSYVLAFLVGGLAAAVLAGVFALVVCVALGNQYASGLAVGILGMGLAVFIGTPYESVTVAPMQSMPIPFLSDLPYVGRGLFDHALPVYLAPIAAVLLWWMFRSSKLGLVVRAAGEAPETTHVLGFDVVIIRIAAIMFGGFMAGMAGTFISTVSATLWADGLIAGRGWIVIALVVFASWRAERVVIGAYFFGLAYISELVVQSTGVDVPSQLLTSVPYVATIIALALLSMDGRRIKLDAPASIGRVYREPQ